MHLPFRGDDGISHLCEAHNYAVALSWADSQVVQTRLPASWRETDDVITYYGRYVQEHFISAETARKAEWCTVRQDYKRENIKPKQSKRQRDLWEDGIHGN